MSFNIIATEPFARKLKKLAKKYHSLREDLLPILNKLENNPKLWTSLGKDCYKIRLSITSKGKGKSVGARLIT